MIIEFKRSEPDDETTDPEIALTIDGAQTRVAIQDCSAYCCGYSVNLYAPEGVEFWMQGCGSFKTLREAKRRALLVWQTRVAS